MTTRRPTKPHQQNTGFSLVELLIAAVILTSTTALAGQALISHIKASEQAEALEQQRINWSRTASFIEADIALSERIFNLTAKPDTEANEDLYLAQLAISIPEECNTEITNPPIQLRLALEHNKITNPAIYFVKKSASGWLGGSTLWRCGPAFDLYGRSLSGSIQMAPILDGLDSDSPGGGFDIDDVSDNGKEVSFALALKGHSLSKIYKQEDASHSRITPLFIRPNEYSYCTGHAFVKVQGTPNSDDLSIEMGMVGAGEDILICGMSGGDTIAGSDGANDILEAGETGGSTMHGYGGDDHLRGTNDPDKPDQLFGGDGDDILIGRMGFDLLNGGCGTNQYLPGPGQDTVIGTGDEYTYGTGHDAESHTPNLELRQEGNCSNQPYDIVFYPETINNFTFSEDCNSKTCTITKNDGSSVDRLKSIEVLIFTDARRDLTK